MPVTPAREPTKRQARTTLDRLRCELLDERSIDGHWVGELSPSALSTATAISALAALYLNDPQEEHHSLALPIESGIRYLSGQQNSDGGFGDTDRSHSNIATSYLVLAASTLADQAFSFCLDREQLDRLERYLDSAGRGSDTVRTKPLSFPS